MREPRIVLFERDDLARELYTEYLVGEGYRVRAEALFDDAMAALKKQQVPLVIAGIAPGGATVAQIAAAIRRTSPHTVMLALLGRDAAEGTLRAVRDGALEALAKPVSAEALSLGVRRCLETTNLLERQPEMRRHFTTYNAARRIQRAVDTSTIAEFLLDASLATTGAEAGVVIRPPRATSEAPEVWAARQMDEGTARELALGLDWITLRQQHGPVVWIPALPLNASPSKMKTPPTGVPILNGSDVTPHPAPLPVPPPRTRGKALAQLLMVRVGAPGAEKLWLAVACGTKATQALVSAPEFERAVSEHELALYASQAAFALDMLRTHPDGALEGSIDPLTDLLDARSLSRNIGHEIELAKKGERGLAVLTLDVQQLPEVRVAQGALVVGQALVECARLLSRQVREVDLVARIGDETFGVLLASTDLKGGERAGERIRNAFAGHRFLAREGLDLPLSVTVGVAGFPEHGQDAAGLLEAARRTASNGATTGRRRTKA
jgi:diguanylate cyclase (GGDEF)-like protein